MDPPATTTTSSDDIITVNDRTLTQTQQQADLIGFKDQVRSDIYEGSGADEPPHPTKSAVGFKHQTASTRRPSENDVDPRAPMAMLEIVEAVPVSEVTDKDLIRSSDLFDSEGQRNGGRDSGSDHERNQTKRFFCIAMILALASFFVAVVVAVLCLTGRCKASVSINSSIEQTTGPQPSTTLRPQAQTTPVPEQQPTSTPATSTSSPFSPSSQLAAGQPTSRPTSLRTTPPTVSPTSTPVFLEPSLPIRNTEIINFINEISLANDGADSPIRYPLPQGAGSTPEERSLTWLIDEDTETSASATATGTQSLRQRYALSTLWFQTPTEPFFTDAHSSTWTNPFVDECDWRGVECNDSGAIVRLNLEESNVQGQLPADLGLLTELTTIRMWENEIRGTLPSALRRLTNLQELRLWDNQLTGTIPSWIGEMTALRLLELDINAFRGTIPSELGLLTALSIVDLAPNNLTGMIPTDLLQLTELRELLLYNNELTGTNPLCLAEGSSGSFSLLAVDCNEVDCPCCTECCGGGQSDIPTRQDCDS